MINRLLGLLGGVPWMLVVLAMVGAWGAAGHWRAHSARTAFAEYRAGAERNARQAEAAERELENQRLQAQKEVQHVQALARAREAAVARSDGVAAASAGERLRDAVAATRNRSHACADPAAAAECAGSVARLADVLGACSREYEQLAADATADVARIRASGAECEALYDALTITPAGAGR